MSNTAVKFSFTDEEIHLLLSCVNEYKIEKEISGKDWESIKTKYEDITDMFMSKYPNTTTTDDINEFPHKPADFTKQRIASKLKTIRQNYKKAIDLGRRSGGGRVVMTFYEQCNGIWSGSPSTTSLGGGFDTGDIEQDSPDTNDTLCSSAGSTLSNSSIDNINDDGIAREDSSNVVGKV